MVVQLRILQSIMDSRSECYSRARGRLFAQTMRHEWKNWVSTGRTLVLVDTPPWDREFIRVHVARKIKGLNGRSEGATRTRPGCCANPGRPSVRVQLLYRMMQLARKWKRGDAERERERDGGRVCKVQWPRLEIGTWPSRSFHFLIYPRTFLRNRI